MRTLRDFNLKGKRVLVRCDFNVPLSEKGEILDDFRIKLTIPTIEYLIEKGAKVILISHLEVDKKIKSLRPIAKKLEEALKKRVYPVKSSRSEVFAKGEQFNRVKFLPDCIGKKIQKEVGKLKEGEILLLENLRFHKEEKENDENFAQELSRLADIFVNEAFSCSHRNHASIVGIPKFLPSVAGLLLEKEIKILSRVLENPEHPFVTIIGGIKPETKLKPALNLLQKADHLLFGSKIGEAILIGKKIILEREIRAEELAEKIDLTSPKIHLPIDGVIALKDLSEEYLRIGAVGTLKKDEEIYDIGPETIKIFKEIIKGAKTILWNGPPGMHEDKRFEKGTKEILDAIVRNYSAFKIAGGGDTISVINKFGLFDKFDFISTGGGAMLEFIAGEKLPGIEALKMRY